MRMCMKCGHVHKGTPDPEACPGCGAIYAKVQAAQESRPATARGETSRPRPAQDDGRRAFLDDLRGRSAYPMYRTVVRAYSALILATGVLVLLAQWWQAKGAAAAFLAFGMVLWVGVVLAAREALLMVADLSDAALASARADDPG